MSDEKLKALDAAREIRFEKRRACEGDVSPGACGVCLEPEHIMAMIGLASAVPEGEPGEWSGYIEQDGDMRARPVGIAFSGMEDRREPLQPDMFEPTALFHTHPFKKVVHPSRDDWALYMRSSAWWGWRTHILVGKDKAIIMQFPTIKKDSRSYRMDLRSERSINEFVSDTLEGCEGDEAEETCCAVKKMGGKCEIVYPGITNSIVLYDEGPCTESED